MLSRDIYSPVLELYRTLEFLNLDDIYELELDKFMH